MNIFLIDDDILIIREFRRKLARVDINFTYCTSKDEFYAIKQNIIKNCDFFILDFLLSNRDNILNTGIFEFIFNQKKESAKLISFSSMPKQIIEKWLHEYNAVFKYDKFSEKNFDLVMQLLNLSSN